MKIHFLTFCIMAIFLSSGESQAQPSIAVRGTYAQEDISKQALFYADALGLDEQVHIIISFTHNMSADKLGFTQHQDTRGLGGGHQVYICINKQRGRSHQMMALAHEMIHAQQFVMGELSQCDDYQYSWQGNLCTDLRQLAYHERPWEQEALATSVKLYDRYKSHRLMAMRTRRNDL